MKTYEEMAQSVIRRAKAHKTVRNRWIVGSVAAVLTLGLCLGTAVIKGPDTVPELQQTPLETTKPVTTAAVPDSARVTFLYSDGGEISDMKLNVEVPCKMELRMKDIRGLSEEEAKAVCEAEGQYAETLIAATPEAKGWQWTQSKYTNTVVTTISAGHFIIAMEDPKQIESICATVEGVLHLSHMSLVEEDYLSDPGLPIPKKLVLDHTNVLLQYCPPYGGVEIGWSLSNNALTKLDQGTLSIGDLRDTITFTVTYVDGTIEDHAIDMIFNDDGEVYALYRGATEVA